MRIGVDVDEVTANMVDPLLIYYNKKHGTNFTRDDLYSYDMWKIWECTRQEAIKEFHNFYDSPYFDQIKPIHGSEGGIEILSEKHELFSITSRPNILYNKTLEWLERYFHLKFEEVIFTNEMSLSGKTQIKGEVCKKLNIELMIEDHLKYANQCVEIGINVYLLNSPWNKGDFPGIKRVYSWQDLIQLVTTE